MEIEEFFYLRFIKEVVDILPQHHQEAQNLYVTLSLSQAQPSSLHPLNVQ